MDIIRNFAHGFTAKSVKTLCTGGHWSVKGQQCTDHSIVSIMNHSLFSFNPPQFELSVVSVPQDIGKITFCSLLYNHNATDQGCRQHDYTWTIVDDHNCIVKLVIENRWSAVLSQMTPLSSK